MDEPLSPAFKARRLIRSRDRATLATSLAEDGWPYASFVMTACGHDGAPLLLMSDLAVHSRNLATDPRASLLFDGTAGLDSPLTGARATVLGRLVKTGDAALSARYVARHPDAAAYLSFGDFHLYRMEVERAHLVAGFGEIHWIDGADMLFDARGCGDLAAAESGIVEHMNADHGDAVGLYATALAGLADGDWAMTGIDPEGIDLRHAGAVGRVDFPASVDGPAAARSILVALVEKARGAAG